MLNRNKNQQKQIKRKPQNLIVKNNISDVKRRGIWIHGKHPVFLAIEKNRREIFQILVTKSTFPTLNSFLIGKKLSHLDSIIKIVEPIKISEILGAENNHQGIAINCSYISLKSQNTLLDELKLSDSTNLPPLLIMDQLQDPHNVGAIIRSACAFGVKKIIFPERNSIIESAAVNKSSSGMIENVDLFLVGNLNQLILKLKEIGYWCVGLAGEGSEDVTKIREFRNIALIIGNEGEGIRELVRKNCDFLVKIAINKEVESLNASVAAAIALREVFVVRNS